MDHALALDPTAPAPFAYAPGQPVLVWSRFDRRWVGGFRIAEPVAAPRPGYRLQRGSDGAVLPCVFGPEDVRAEHRVTD